MFDTQTEQTINYPLSSAALPVSVQNSLFRPDETPVFYVNNKGYFDLTGQQIGFLNSFTDFTSEIEVVPQPGSCGSYCVLFMSPVNFVNMNLIMQEVIIDPAGTITIGNETGWVSQNDEVPFPFTGNQGGLAVSKPQADASRLVYIVSFDKITILKIDNTGLNLLSEINSPIFEAPRTINEVDLSDDGEYLVWADRLDSDGLNILNTSTNTHRSLAIPPGVGNSVTGVEFYSNELTDQLDLYVTFASGGTYVYTNVAEIPSQPIQINSFINTQLEQGKNGKIYGVQNDLLFSIDPANSNQTTILSVPSTASFFPVSGATGAIYTLPQQVDGEDDDKLVTIIPPEVENLSINGVDLPEVQTGTLPNFYNCAPINLDAPTTDPTDEITVTVRVLVGNFEFIIGIDNYTINDFPLDLNCLTPASSDPASNCALFDNWVGRPFKVTLSVEPGLNNERCPVSPTVVEGYFEVSGDPDDLSPDLIVNNSTAGDPGCQSNDINNPCQFGPLGGSFRVDASSGTIEFYEYSLFEVNCATGTVGAQLFTSGLIDDVDISSVGAITFASLEIDGTTNYFSSANVSNDDCFLVRITIGNVCGQATEESYLQFDSSLPIVGDGSTSFLGQPENDQMGGLADMSSLSEVENNTDRPGIQDMASQHQRFEVYPNPARDLLHISIPVVEESMRYRLLNAQGQLLQSGQLSTLTTLHTVDLSRVPSGLYFLSIAGHETKKFYVQ